MKSLTLFLPTDPQGGYQQQPYPGYPPANGAGGGGFAPPPSKYTQILL